MGGEEDRDGFSGIIMVKQLHRKMIDCLPANDGPVLAGGRSLSGAKIKFSAGAGARGGGAYFCAGRRFAYSKPGASRSHG